MCHFLENRGKLGYSQISVLILIEIGPLLRTFKYSHTNKDENVHRYTVRREKLNFWRDRERKRERARERRGIGYY